MPFRTECPFRHAAGALPDVPAAVVTRQKRAPPCARVCAIRRVTPKLIHE